MLQSLLATDQNLTGIGTVLLRSSRNMCMDRSMVYERELLKIFSGCDAVFSVIEADLCL
jgi:hypothetical protein